MSQLIYRRECEHNKRRPHVWIDTDTGRKISCRGPGDVPLDPDKVLDVVLVEHDDHGEPMDGPVLLLHDVRLVRGEPDGNGVAFNVTIGDLLDVLDREAE